MRHHIYERLMMTMRAEARHSAPSKPLFSCGQELADLVVASHLLQHSWAAISDLYSTGGSGGAGGLGNEPTTTETPLSSPPSVRYKAYQRPKFTIVAFVCEKVRELSPTLQPNHPLFESLCTKENPSISLNQEAITLFHSLLDELHRQVGRSTPLIITGHYMGGSVASLFTLWLLKSMAASAKSHPLCITFGSPLVGDNGLLQAIIDSSTWNSHFLHVVSEDDLVPRLFISSHKPLTVNSDSQTSGYKPFGTFLMCSQSGCACVNDSESVLDLLNATRSEDVRTLGDNCLDYGGLLEHLNKKIIYRGTSEIHDGLMDSLQAGIVLQLQAIGAMDSMYLENKHNTLIPAMKKREQANYFSYKRGVLDPTKKLNTIKINMAFLEWYKKVSKATGMGYYDSYKAKQHQRDMDVIKYKNILTNYWKDMVRAAERKPQKQWGSFQTPLLYAGTNYRRMVEPLDIADYYSVQGQKDYLNQGRSLHYVLLEKWQEEVEIAEGHQKIVQVKNVAPGLTEDSCFWVRVEEAIILSKLLKNGEAIQGTDIPYRDNLVHFEKYVMDLIEKRAVSPEIFLMQSSFMQWWREYEIILEPLYNSPLMSFMKNHSYQQYA